MADWMPLVTGLTSVPAPDPVAALARLAAVVTAAEVGEDRDRAVGEIAAMLGDGDLMRGLGAAHRADAAPVASLVMRLGALAGVKQRAARLDRAIRDEAKR